MSGHRFKKIARQLQKLWGVSYTEALRACIDTHEAGNFQWRHDRYKEEHPDARFKDILYALCIEDWAFED